ncbi:hypothetical protein CW748_17575 [Alteromonadales bacterium alter-6D02]|nr:hypothetical protein CW748_17575 [Alteromonadales bacterium alter-6D02]
MVEALEQWIEQTNQYHEDKRLSCTCLLEKLNGFYSLDFLQNSYFVIVPVIPMPDRSELRQLGLDDLLNKELNAFTYKNTYYILPHVALDINTHFHELVRVAQWQHFGTTGFLERYITEIQCFGCLNAPLRKVATGLSKHFLNQGCSFDVPTLVSHPNNLDDPLITQVG